MRLISSSGVARLTFCLTAYLWGGIYIHPLKSKRPVINSITYTVGLIVVFGAILAFPGLR